MRTIEELLENLARPEVSEFGLVTNRLPSVNIGGKFEPVDDEAPSTERLMQMLVTMGGGRHVDSLGDKPVQWTTRLDGVGVIAVAAILRHDILQARFTVAKREPTSVRVPSRHQSQAPASSSPMVASKPLPARQPQGQPSSMQLRAQAPASPPSSMPFRAAAPASSARVIAAVPVEPDAPDAEFGDDDEPTLQTQAPPVVTPMSGQEPRPKPPRRPEDLARGNGAGAFTAAPDTEVTAEHVMHVVVHERKDEATHEQSASATVTSGATPGEDSAVRRVNEARDPTLPDSIAETTLPHVDASASVDSFLAMAMAANASDLHIVAGRPILLRIATELLPRTRAISAEHVERIVKELVPERLHDTLDKQGSCDFAIDHTTCGRFRVHASRQRTGYMVVFRVIPKVPPTLAGLGLPEGLSDVVRQRSGLVLVAAPASQGKSSTLAALVDVINRDSPRHIMTIEDPVEHLFVRRRGLVSQRDAGLHSRTRSRTIETALRADIDVLVFGELRDAEDIRSALLACEDGRLVLAAWNATGAAKAVDAMMDRLPSHERAWGRSVLAASLRLVIGQRLVPSVDKKRLHAAVELLAASPPLTQAVRDGRTELSDVVKRTRLAGVVRLDESLAELVRAHKVTLEAAKLVADSPADIEARVAHKSAPSAMLARKV
ncbi:MAG TPA: ATPase, T2SS/T4P/T4SS family [Labilithrix sp.]|nr:ATPase, T2SS/T4P/T4SS family [Labilithrix sp.]